MKKKQFSVGRAAAKTAAIYAVFGFMWIKFSDMILEAVIHDAVTMSSIQTWKGWFFIFVTVALLYGLMLRNLRAQRRYEESLRESEAQLDAVFRAASDVAFILTRSEGTVRTVEAFSPGAEQLFGISAHNAVGKPVTSLGLSSGLFRYSYKDGAPQSIDVRWRGLNGEEHYILASVLPLFADDSNSLLLTVGMDFSDFKRMESELRLTQSYMRNILDSMPSVIVGVDTDGCITHWNTAASVDTGLPVEMVKGRMVEDVYPVLREYMGSIITAMSRREPFRVEHLEKPDDDMVWDMLVYPLVGEDVKGAVIRLDNVSDRVRLQEIMVQTEKMMSVGGLAAGMAHEINNPLGGILQGVQNIRRRLSQNIPANISVAESVGCSLDSMYNYMEQRKVFHLLDGIYDSGKRAADIVANMLEFSRRSDASQSLVDLEVLMDKAVELAANDYDLKKQYDFKNIDIVREFTGDLPAVTCSSMEIEQVLLNLLRNAAQAMGKKGYSSPDTMGATHQAEEWSPRIILRTSYDDSHVVLEVEDNGPGIPDTVRKRVFEPFFTTKPVGEGTGLGLSVAYFIVTSNHNGLFEVHSDPGKGARFTIRLPYSS